MEVCGEGKEGEREKREKEDLRGFKDIFECVHGLRVGSDERQGRIESTN